MSDKKQVFLMIFLVAGSGSPLYAMDTFESIRASFKVYKALPSTDRLREVGGALCLGMAGGSFLRSQIAPINAIAQIITLGHPVLVDAFLGVFLGISAWKSTAAREKDWMALRDQMKNLRGELARVHGTVTTGFENMHDGFAGIQGNIAGLSRQIGAVDDRVGALNAGIVQLHAQVTEGFVRSHERVDHLLHSVGNLHADVMNNHDRVMVKIAGIQVCMNARFDRLEDQVKKTSSVMAELAHGQHDIKDLVVRLNNGSSEDSARIKGIYDRTVGAIGKPLIGSVPLQTDRLVRQFGYERCEVVKQ